MLNNLSKENIQAQYGDSEESLSIEIQRAAFRRMLADKDFSDQQIRSIIFRCWQEGFFTAEAAFDLLLDEGILGSADDLLTIYVEGIAAIEARREAEAIAMSLSTLESDFAAVEPADAVSIAPPSETLLDVLAQRRGNHG